MLQFEYFPTVIEAHRNDLHALAQPLPSEIAVSSRRPAIGQRIVQLGRLLMGKRPAIMGDTPTAVSVAPGTPPAASRA
jgi:hypothetical protein